MNIRLRDRFAHLAITSAVSTLILLGACGTKTEVREEKIYQMPPQDTLATVVKTMKLEPGDFNMEVISNGTIEAGEIVPLSFERSGMIANVFVRNGQHVKKGEAIADLDMTDILRQKERKILDSEDSEIQLKDILIGQGYSYEKKEEIPEKVMKFALIKSGYLRNKQDIEDIERTLGKCTLRAPFNGVIANIKGAAGAATSGPLCDLIGTSSMEVEFPVLQSELGIVDVGTPVAVRSYNPEAETWEGRVVSINPVVDDKGQVKVRASVASYKSLMAGMSVRVLIRKVVPDQLVVPKTAVEERSGRKVIFTVADGKAFWHYVNVGLRNTTQYTITDGLEAGDEIVVAGARNLSEGCYVKIQR